MTQKDIEKLMQEVNKKSPDNNIWFTSEIMADVYLLKFFNGTEHDLLKSKYRLRLFGHILSFLYDYKNIKNNKLTPNVMEDFIYQIRKTTYKMRKKILFDWINHIGEKTNSEDCLTQYLITFFPKLNEISEVRKQLGLNYEIK